MPGMIGESGYERNARDAYFTPAWCTLALLQQTEPLYSVHDPACGDGAICKVFWDKSILAKASDIHDYGYRLTERRDFFTYERSTYDIVTNPPYSCADEFVRHAIKITEQDGRRVIMLLRNEWDCAKKRVDLFQHPAFKAKYVLTRRPNWAHEAEQKASPRHNFAWFEWDWSKDPNDPPTIGWVQ